MIDLNDLAFELRQISSEHGFPLVYEEHWNNDPNLIATKIAMIMSELGEMIEALRKNDREGFDEEAADTFIRLLDLWGGLCSEIEKPIREKMEINRQRAYRHGGKRV